MPGVVGRCSQVWDRIIREPRSLRPRRVCTDGLTSVSHAVWSKSTLSGDVRRLWLRGERRVTNAYSGTTVRVAELCGSGVSSGAAGGVLRQAKANASPVW